MPDLALALLTSLMFLELIVHDPFAIHIAIFFTFFQYPFLNKVNYDQSIKKYD